MKRNQAINLIKTQFPKLRDQYGVRHIALFGSVARNEATPKSDIDILVEFEDKPTFDRFMDLKFFLEDTLHSPIDLVTQDAVKPRLRPYIEKDLHYVA